MRHKNAKEEDCPGGERGGVPRALWERRVFLSLGKERERRGDAFWLSFWAREKKREGVSLVGARRMESSLSGGRGKEKRISVEREGGLRL